MEKNHRLGILSVKQSHPLRGEIVASPDKSISHRALIISAVALGISKISNLLESEDVFATMNALVQMGVNIYRDCKSYFVEGRGIKGLNFSKQAINCGNSGTSCRLLMGLVAPYSYCTYFYGDQSLSMRSQYNVIKMLENFGVNFECNNYKMPLLEKGYNHLYPVEYHPDSDSAQIKSAFILAAINIPGISVYHENIPTRDHTEKLLQYYGYPIVLESKKIIVHGEKQHFAKDVIIPGDPSSAIFLVTAALLIKGSYITIKNVCVNPRRFRAINLLQVMGGNIEISSEKSLNYEKVVDITVQSSDLSAIEVEEYEFADLVDEYPILCVAAALSKGVSIFKGLGGLRNKESNRLQMIYENLKLFNIDVTINGDSLIIKGGNPKGGIVVDSQGDHRIAMAFSILSACCKERSWIKTYDMIKTSYPRFLEDLSQIGFNITYL